MIRIYYLLALSLIFCELGYAQEFVSHFYDPAMQPVELSIDVSHLNADIRLEPKDCRIIAWTQFKFTAKRLSVDSIVFFTPDFKFSKVELSDVKSNYVIRGSEIIIYPLKPLLMNQEYTLTFEYKAEPSDGNPYFVGWNDPKGLMRKQIWAHRPHGWLPFYDDRMTVDMKVTFDKNFSVFSNGVRVSITDNANGTKTWHYRMEKNHPFFSTALVVGNYLFKSSKSNSGVPLELWYYPDQEDRYETTYQYSAQMIDFFEKEMGLRYPYELYRQAPVADYLFGAMETTTSTVFGDYMFINRRAYWQRNYINVNAHELAHQWFGNYISHLTPRDVWLTESFATFYAKLFERSVFGDDFYQYDKLSEIDKAFSESKKNSNPIASSRAGTNRIYQKGSLVLDMLRYVTGDDIFHMAVKYYLENNDYKYAETQDFFRAFYNVSGQNYDWFFDEWLYRGGEPHYEISYASTDDDNGKRNTIVTVKQIHKTDHLVKFFRMPIDFLVYYKDGTRDSIRANVQDEISRISIPNPKRLNVDFIIFDSGNKILKKTTFVRSINELLSQAKNASGMIDRYEALVALRDFPLKEKFDVLYKCYDQEKFHLNKSEIIRQVAAQYDSQRNKVTSIINPSDNSPVLLLKKAINDPDAFVRKSVIENIKSIHADLKKPFTELLRDTSYLNIELALTKLYEEYPGDAGLFLDITKNETGWRGRNIKVKWLEISVLEGNAENLEHLVDFSSGSYDFETRINAIQALKRINHFDKEYALLLIEAANYWNFKLVDVAREALKYYYINSKNRVIIENLLNSSKIPEKWKYSVRAFLN